MTEPVRLIPEPLTKDAFSPFGKVIEKAGAQIISINEGTTERFHALAQADMRTEAGEAIVSIFAATKRPSPIEIRMMERHPLGSQAFFPLSPHPWLVVACKETPPRPEALKAFLARGDQGVQYARNVWHFPLLIIEARQDFLVVDREGPGDNLEEVWFEEGARALLEAPAG